MRRRKHLHLPAEGKEEAIDPGILRIPNGHGQRTVLFPPDILPAEAVEHPVGRRGGEAQGQGGGPSGRGGKDSSSLSARPMRESRKVRQAWRVRQ